VFMVKKVFINSKPKVIPRTIDVDEFKDLQTINTESEGVALEDAELLGDASPVSPDSPKVNVRARGLTTKRYHSNLDLIKANKMETRQSTLRSALSEVKKTKSAAAQLKLANDVRITLLDTVYPLPHRFKRFAWLFVVAWTLFAAVMAIFYGLQFDLKYAAEANAQNENVQNGLYGAECWRNNKLLELEDLLSIRSIADLQNSLESTFSGSYAADSESAKWLLSMIQSLVLSILVWQPLTVYLVTWAKVWMFSWNLRMKMAPSNVATLCRRACSCSRSRSQNLQTETEIDLAQRKNKKGHDDAYYIIAHQNRPLDVIGYFSNDELFLRIDEGTGKLLEIESDSENLDDDFYNTVDDAPRETNMGGEGGAEELEMISMAMKNGQRNDVDEKSDAPDLELMGDGDGDVAMPFVTPMTPSGDEQGDTPGNDLLQQEKPTDVAGDFVE